MVFNACPYAIEGSTPLWYGGEQIQADGSEPAEIVDISTLDLRQLRTLLGENELSSRDALDKALLKKQSAERYYELARTREAEAQSYLRRNEDAEIFVQDLLKAIVDRSKLVLERQFVTSPTPAREKQQHVSLYTQMLESELTNG